MHFFSASEYVKLFYTGAIYNKAWLHSSPCYYTQFHKNKLVGFIYAFLSTTSEPDDGIAVRKNNIEHFYIFPFNDSYFRRIRTGIPGENILCLDDRRKNRQMLLMNFSP